MKVSPWGREVFSTATGIPMISYLFVVPCLMTFIVYICVCRGYRVRTGLMDLWSSHWSVGLQKHVIGGPD